MTSTSASSAATSARTALILGPTGAVGRHVLSSLVSSSQYAKVYSIVRREGSTPHGDGGMGDKVKEIVVDFEKLADEQLASGSGSGSVPGSGPESSKLSSLTPPPTDVYITLGTTRAQAGSAKSFERIDREYVVAGAKAALLGSNEGQKTLVYCSSAGSNEKSFFLYPRSKGQTESSLLSLPYSTTYLFRPGFLSNAQRSQTRWAEHIFGIFVDNVLAKFSDSVRIETERLGEGMVKLVSEPGVAKEAGIELTKKDKSEGEWSFVSNAQALKLAK